MYTKYLFLLQTLEITLSIIYVQSNIYKDKIKELLDIRFLTLICNLTTFIYQQKLMALIRI